MGRPANKISKVLEDYILDNLRYDPETGHLWWTKKGGNGRKMQSPAGHNHVEGYIEVTMTFNKKQHRVMAHRIAWFLHYGYWPENFLDHINGDKKDNRITNLREATHTQNMANVGKRKTSPKRIVKTNSPPHISHKTYVGVYLLPSGNWAAKHKGHLATFPTPEEAALCYNEAVKKSYGEYALLNVVDSPKESCHTDNVEIEKTQRKHLGAIK